MTETDQQRQSQSEGRDCRIAGDNAFDRGSHRSWTMRDDYGKNRADHDGHRNATEGSNECGPVPMEDPAQNIPAQSVGTQNVVSAASCESRGLQPDGQLSFHRVVGSQRWPEYGRKHQDDQ